MLIQFFYTPRAAMLKVTLPGHYAPGRRLTQQ